MISPFQVLFIVLFLASPRLTESRGIVPEPAVWSLWTRVVPSSPPTHRGAEGEIKEHYLKYWRGPPLQHFRNTVALQSRRENDQTRAAEGENREEGIRLRGEERER